ncbi:MAG: DUF4105 domain-containing protein [Bacteroidales bacterium]|nr:DUF4105 domain-containing protein [Bacteroidales bacterium]
MKRKSYAIFLFFILVNLRAFTQSPSDTTVYLITCGPGTEIYSIYGHSALRVTIPDRGIDLSYNWGVFDFDTPNFGLRFARGNLEYMLDADNYSRFLRIYEYEKRWVKSQVINLSPSEKRKLTELIAENLKPENIKYRYDFLFDNCATRIRDILEKATDGRIIYTPSGRKDALTFRFLTGTYQQQYPWLDFGIDVLLGTPCDKKAEDRDKMFLPLELQGELTEASIMRGGRMIPFLQNPVTVLNYKTPVNKPGFLTHPFLVFSLISIGIIIFSARVREGRAVKIIDLIIFSTFSLLAVLLVITNFFSLHHQLKYNLSMLWISPLIPVCLAAVILNREWYSWFRIVFLLCVLSFIIHLLFPMAGNGAFVPLTIILMLRSSVRAGFSWNPLSLKSI